MKKSRRKFTAEFKAKVAIEAIKGIKTIISGRFTNLFLNNATRSVKNETIIRKIIQVVK